MSEQTTKSASVIIERPDSKRVAPAHTELEKFCIEKAKLSQSRVIQRGTSKGWNFAVTNHLLRQNFRNTHGGVLSDRFRQKNSYFG